MDIYPSDLQALTDLLVGRKVVHVSIVSGKAVLDDGTTLTLRGNDGGCSCGAGDYDLTTLNRVDNIITAVELDEEPSGDDTPYNHEGYYKIFVFADNQRINLATFTGDDGNGYYGSGYSIHVERPTTSRN